MRRALTDSRRYRTWLRIATWAVNTSWVPLWVQAWTERRLDAAARSAWK